MAIAVYGDREVMDRMMFGAPTPQLMDYINQSSQYFVNSLTDVGRSFVNHATSLFTRMDTSEAMQIARAALRMANTYFQNDVIYTMTSVSQLQEAPDSMVRWIMTDPVLAQYHADNRIDGYGNRFVNPYPGLYGWDNPDYQQVYSGWMNTVVETKEVTLEDGSIDTVEEFYDVWTEALEDEDYVHDVQLLDVEASAIILAHELAAIAVARNQDPTSYYDSQIG